MKRYYIKKLSPKNINQPMNIDWSIITALSIDNFPWYIEGKKQNTEVKLCRDTKHVYLRFHAQDRYSVAKQTQLNHMNVCDDSCVEFFFSPSGVLGSSYVNIEINCCGTLHVAYGENRDKREFISKELAEKIHCTTSIKSKTKLESKYDNDWVVEVIIPFTVIEQLTGKVVNKSKWFANFYRCGGQKQPQFASWSLIKTKEPDFHQPNYFSEIVFDQ